MVLGGQVVGGVVECLLDVGVKGWRFNFRPFSGQLEIVIKISDNMVFLYVKINCALSSAFFFFFLVVRR